MLDVLDNHEKLTNSEEIRAAAEFKVEVEAIKQQQVIKLAK
jgi:hypothetical protein